MLRLRNHRGLTLVEFMMVALIILLLAAMAIPKMYYAALEVRYKACYANVYMINSQMELFHVLTKVWPFPGAPNTPVKDTDFGRDISYFPNGVPACPVTGADYLIDNANHRVLNHDKKARETHLPFSP